MKKYIAIFITVLIASLGFTSLADAKMRKVGPLVCSAKHSLLGVVPFGTTYKSKVILFGTNQGRNFILKKFKYKLGPASKGSIKNDLRISDQGKIRPVYWKSSDNLKRDGKFHTVNLKKQDYGYLQRSRPYRLETQFDVKKIGDPNCSARFIL